MSTQEVFGLTTASRWRHVLAGFPPITVHDQAVALSAALEREGLLDAPAGNQRVAELYHETVGVHLEAQRVKVDARLETKKLDGLDLVVVDRTRGSDAYRWTHGDLVVTSEVKARKFSAALKSKGLLEAPPGHWLVEALHRELFASDLEKAIAKKKKPGLEPQVVDLLKGNFAWSHGDCVVNNEADADKFSDALGANELLDARPGDPRVHSTARKLSLTDTSSLVDFHRSRNCGTSSS